MAKRQNNTTLVNERTIVAGFGGQGIMLMGKILAQTAMKADLNVTWIPKYGAEVRGGTSHCMIRVATRPIDSPMVIRPSALVVMNKPSLLRFEAAVEPNGLILVNSSMIDSQVARKDVRVLYVPANDIASQLGDIKGANMVALGALLQAWGFIDLDIAKDAIKDILPAYRHKYIPLNQQAIHEGAAYVMNQRK